MCNEVSEILGTWQGGYKYKYVGELNDFLSLVRRNPQSIKVQRNIVLCSIKNRLAFLMIVP